MVRLVDEASSQEEALRAKRKKVQAAKDEMKLTDNLIAAFSQQASSCRHALKDNGNGAMMGVSLSYLFWRHLGC